MDQVTDILRQLSDAVGGQQNLAAIAAGIVVLLIVMRFVRGLFRGKAAGPAQERGVQEERLADFPPAPAGSAHLRVEGRPARLRLVIVAPVGKDAAIDVATVENQLDQIVYGLGKVAKRDHPRIKVWPPQLSNKGFTLTFVRMMVRPEPMGRPSRWILVAGPTLPRPRPLMLGLVVQTEEPSSVGHISVTAEQWTSVVQMV
jgi:hypothetical protein